MTVGKCDDDRRATARDGERNAVSTLKPMTEAQAIAALQRLGARWPKSLRLVHHGSGGGRLHVMRNDGRDPGSQEPIASVSGFSADSCA